MEYTVEFKTVRRHVVTVEATNREDAKKAAYDQFIEEDDGLGKWALEYTRIQKGKKTNWSIKNLIDNITVFWACFAVATFLITYLAMATTGYFFRLFYDLLAYEILAYPVISVVVLIIYSISEALAKRRTEASV